MVTRTLDRIRDEFATQQFGSPTNQFGVRQFDRDFASQTLAAIRRAQFEDYKTRFRPVEDILFGAARPAFTQQLSRDAQQNFNQGFQNSQRSNAMQLAGYGLRMSPEQQRLGESRRRLGEVQAANQAARAGRDMQTQVLGIGSPTRGFGLGGGR